MTHARQQIRQQLATTLTGLTTTGANVYASRVYDTATTPCLLIYTDSDTVIDDNHGGGKDWHELTITVEARAKATSTVDNTVDTICKEVETAIFADRTLNGEVKDIRLQGTDITLSAETEQPVAVASMTFITDYRIAPGTPGSKVD